jgi:hypothetical protein
MTDGFSMCMDLLDELEQNSVAALTLPVLTAQERSLLLGRLTALYAAIAADTGAAAASAARDLQDRELQLASRWFG